MDRQKITEHYSRPAQVQNRPKYTPKRLTHTTQSWKQKIAGSCLAILWLGSTATAYAQEAEVTYGVNRGNDVSRLCNNGYVEHKKKIYEVSALHCKTGATWHEAVNKDDIKYMPVASLPFGIRAMKALEKKESVENGELDQKEVTVQLCVYNIDGETWQNKYCKPFVERAQYDSAKRMYFIEIPLHIKRWYTENVSEFCRSKMKSSSGSPVEWEGKFVGVISWIGFNATNKIGSTGMKPYEGRLYFAPAKKHIAQYSI